MTTQTINKTITFEKVLIDLKKFLAGKNSPRPVLNLIYFDGTYLYATDSHKAIRLDAQFVELPSNEPFLYDPATNNMLDAYGLKYPDLNRLFPDHANTELNVSAKELKELKAALKDISALSKENRNYLTKMNITDSAAEFQSKGEKSQLEKSYVIQLDQIKGEAMTLHVSSKQLKDLLIVAEKLNKISGNKSEIQFVSKMRPITVTDNKAYTMILMPIRVY